MTQADKTSAPTLFRRQSGPGGLVAAGLFSGIGGIETGLARAGFETALMCESWQPARNVLEDRFPGVEIAQDVSTLKGLPDAHLLAAGFPCTDLSLAGSLTGIGGSKSGLVQDVFRLARMSRPEWILLENVPHMLGLHQGAAMRLLTGELERMGYDWAYRTVDSRFTGVPQRRPRVLVLASRRGRPADVLLGPDVGAPTDEHFRDDAYGFYWTEGRRGLGWVRDGLPPLKGGSTIGILSHPAVWLPDADAGSRIVLSVLGDGERLQGFAAGWTRAAATERRREDHRWKLVGNAVTTNVAAWIGRRIAADLTDGTAPWAEPDPARPIDRAKAWPGSGWGGRRGAWAADVSAWPRRQGYRHLKDLLDLDGATPLSHRATAGFLSRLQGSGHRHPDPFMADLREHVRMTAPAA